MDAVRPTKGLSQGDPLSSFLFVLCMEQLSHWIKNREASGVWKGLKTSRRSPIVSHLFFADDILMFTAANCSQVEVIREGLNLFSKASGQRINFSKSNV